MTNAIETTKREMYEALRIVRECFASLPISKFESALESYLEQVRQDHEALHETARDRFETIQSLEQANEALTMKNDTQRQIIEDAGGTNELRYQLSAMTEERDAIRNKLQAFEFANKSAGEFLIDALRKVKSQRKTIKTLRKAQEARESVGATSVSSCEEVSPDQHKDEPKPHSQSCARPVDGVTYVSTSESDGVVSIYCTACHRMTKKVATTNLEEAKKLFAESWV